MKINAVMDRQRLETCVESLRDWCSSRRLHLNPDKTELIWIDSRTNLLKLRKQDVMSLNLCSVAVEPVDSVRDLGVNLDSELSMRVDNFKQNFIKLRFPSSSLGNFVHWSIQHPHNVSRQLSYCRGLPTVTQCSPVYIPVPLHHCSEFWMLLPALWSKPRIHVSGIVK